METSLNKIVWLKCFPFLYTSSYSSVTTWLDMYEPDITMSYVPLSQRNYPYYVKSTQYKKLVPNALRFTHQNLKSCKSHEKNETKSIRLLVFSFLSNNLALWCFLFYFFMWFARFQISICELQSIWSKLLVLRCLYNHNFSTWQKCHKVTIPYSSSLSIHYQLSNYLILCQCWFQ